MSNVKWGHLPRGEHESQGDRLNSSGGCKKRKKIFMLVGIFMISILSWSIRAEAAASDLFPQDEVEIPKLIIEYCETVGEQYDICPELLEAMAYNESRFIPTVKCGNCWGILQVNVKVHAQRIEDLGYTPEDMFSPYPCIVTAADYLADLFETYGDDDVLVLCYYSGNLKAAKKYKEYGFITDYVDTVLTRSEHYERLHGK